jgi:hypothetical protein
VSPDKKIDYQRFHARIRVAPLPTKRVFANFVSKSDKRHIDGVEQELLTVASVAYPLNVEAQPAPNRYS